jgi:hypothetical protein
LFHRVALLFVMVLAGCGTGVSTPAPYATIPVVPSPPPGAVSLGSWAGTAPGQWGLQLSVPAGNVYIHASCNGGGTLIVLATMAADARAYAAQSAVFTCYEGDAGRIPMSLPAGTSYFTAYVAEGFGSLTTTAFAVSIEQGG